LNKSILITVLTFSAFIACNLHAQDYGRVHTLITEGTNAIYNIDYQGALSKFQEARSIAPNDLRGSFFESTVYFWKALFTRNRQEYENYLDLSDKLVDRCEDIIDKNENDLDAQFYMGWTHTIRAFLIYWIDKNVLKAATEIKDGNQALTFVVERNPAYYDAYLGLGIYNYILSFIPRKLQWLTSILGYTGDREAGKSQLITASEKGTYTNTEARVYLTLLAWREENYALAEDYATRLTNQFPESPAVWMLWGLLLSQQDKMQEAVEAYEKAITLNESKKSEIIYKTSYGALGNAYYRMNNFEKAVEFLKKYLAYVTKDDMYNNRLFNLGVSLELTGKRNEALEYYRQARKDFTEDNQWERFHFRRLNYRAQYQMTVVDSLLIVADNNRAVGKLNESLKDYQRLQSDFDQVFSDDIAAQLNHGVAQLYSKQKDYNKAIEQFKLNLNLNPNEEKWLVPEAYYQIGRCYLRLGNNSEATKYFDMALDVDYDYDFKDNMDIKIKNALSRN
jgi:tetratricopeptide (TPR) repeat protein